MLAKSSLWVRSAELTSEKASTPSLTWFRKRRRSRTCTRSANFATRRLHSRCELAKNQALSWSAAKKPTCQSAASVSFKRRKSRRNHKNHKCRTRSAKSLTVSLTAAPKTRQSWLSALHATQLTAILLQHQRRPQKKSKRRPRLALLQLRSFKVAQCARERPLPMETRVLRRSSSELHGGISKSQV